MAHIVPVISGGLTPSAPPEAAQAQQPPTSAVHTPGQTGAAPTHPIYADTRYTLERLPLEVIRKITNHFPNGSEEMDSLGLTSRTLRNAMADRIKASRLMKRVENLHTLPEEEQQAIFDAIAVAVNDHEVQLTEADQDKVVVALVDKVYSQGVGEQEAVDEEAGEIAGFNRVCDFAANFAANTEDLAATKLVVAALLIKFNSLSAGRAEIAGFNRVCDLAADIEAPAFKTQFVVVLARMPFSFLLEDGLIDGFNRVCDLADGIEAPESKAQVVVALENALYPVPEGELRSAITARLAALKAGEQ